MAEETRIAVIIAMAKSLLDYNRIDSIAEVFGKIDLVSAAQLQEIANENLISEQLSMLTYLPTE